MNKLLLLPGLLLICFHAGAQNAADTATTKDKALKVFLDCDYCDMDYLRTEVTYVNYVRDRAEAQVDIIASSITTGSGGTEYTFVFKGQHEFEGKADTLKFDVQSFETDEARRKGIAQVLKLGLVRYIAKTPFASKLNISYAVDTATARSAPTPVKDKWKSWVFSTSFNGYLNGQQLTKYSFLAGSFSASKVTPGWKISFGAGVSYNKSTFVIPDSTIISLSKNESCNGQFVKSINEHFSWGGNASVSTSTYSNLKLQERFSPGFEYSVFPYSQATHRMITFLYYVYGVNTNYIDTTIYGKVKEMLYGESLTSTINFKEPWGSMNTAITGSHYFYDITKNNLSLSESLNINLFQGFTVNLYGSVSLVHDQLFLPAQGATADEILLQIKTLATSYYYYASIGFTYTFGSIYNNVVNPRFGG